ncbi:MAG: VanZ family protein [Lachnospiraceae bacterium]|nr:VanZ family protein [Lachnospiraceae bacterium]
MNNRETKGRWRRIAVTGVAAALLLLLYSIIFRFSAQDGQESGSLSQFFSEKCVNILDSLSGANWTQGRRMELAAYFEHPIRKLAHFSEYACMGILVYTLWSQWMKPGRKRCLLTVAWVFLSAAGDEFHQYFVPGRYASIADVLLDTCGGAFGMLVCICISALYRRARERGVRKRESRGMSEN